MTNPLQECRRAAALAFVLSSLEVFDRLSPILPHCFVSDWALVKPAYSTVNTRTDQLLTSVYAVVLEGCRSLREGLRVRGFVWFGAGHGHPILGFKDPNADRPIK